MHGHQVTTEGGELALSALLATFAAGYLVLEGRLVEAREVLPAALALRAPGRVAIQARAFAMQLALRQGRPDEADAHRARIRELWPDFEHNPAWNGPPVLAEYLLAREGPGAAMTMLGDTIRREAAVDPGVADLMVMWGARAAAEWSQNRDGHGEPATATVRPTSWSGSRPYAVSLSRSFRHPR